MMASESSPSASPSASPSHGNSFASILGLLAAKQPLPPSVAEHAFAQIFAGHVGPASIGAFIMALQQRGESVDDLVAGASQLRALSPALDLPADCVDNCGTGGDGLHTLNISTAAAIVAAGAGVKMAKHGGRAASSKSGSAEVLARLGVRLDLAPDEIIRSIDVAGMAFFFAGHWHPAMGRLADIRRELGFRSVFNLLGPLTNPARVKRQILGVSRPELLPIMAQSLIALGIERAFVVHGTDGMDEISICAPTLICEILGGHMRNYKVEPADFGISTANIAALRGGDDVANARAIELLLAGERSAFRDAVLVNATIACMVAGKCTDPASGMELCAQSIDHGHAARVLQKLVACSTQSGAHDAQRQKGAT